MQSAWAFGSWTPSTNLPAGSLLVVFVENDGGPSNVTGDNLGNTYTKVGDCTVNNGGTFENWVGAYICTLKSQVNSGSTITVTFDANGGLAGTVMAAVTAPSGLSLDAVSVITGTIQNTGSTLLITSNAAASGELFFAVGSSRMTGANGTGSITGWTTVNSGTGNVPGVAGHIGDNGLDGASQAANFGFTNSGWAACMAFAVTTAPPGVPRSFACAPIF
jgi:hypothetical protein